MEYATAETFFSVSVLERGWIGRRAGNHAHDAVVVHLIDLAGDTSDDH